jgi:HKD family nuclease
MPLVVLCRKKADATKCTDKLKPSTGLMGEGSAAVFGMPPGFDLFAGLSESSHIRLATAFAHASGWNLISDSIEVSKGQIDILAGLHYFQTEPKLLRTWLKKSYQSRRFSCRVVTNAKGSRWTFHPKVLIVSGRQCGDFAVVGSGNLSAGGLRDNVECGLFTHDRELVSTLSEWFDDVSKSLAVKLEEPIIKQYEPLYKKYQQRLGKLTQEETVDLQKINKEVEASLRHWDKAVADAKAFFASSQFGEEWEKCQDAARRIRASLNDPEFEFTYEGWQEFLNIREFGNLAAIQLHRKKLFGKLGKIGNAFRILIDDRRNELPRLEEVFSGASKVEFIGTNVLTKVLAAHDGTRWPVYNSKVEGVLRGYGYWIPRGLTEAEKYSAYVILMRKFAAASGARDVYALDRFFLHASRQR